MAKTISMTDSATIEAARRAAAKADTMYQFSVSLGLALMAGVVGTAGAFMMHGVL